MMEATEIGSHVPSASGTMIDRNIRPASTVCPIDGEMSEEEDEWYNRLDHPLMNNVVLDAIFKRLSGIQLKECRLVCKTWNASTIPFIREHFVVIIHGNPENKFRTIDNFVEVFRHYHSNKLGIPFARFKLRPFCTTNGVGEEFLQLCGTTAKYIKLLDGSFRVEDVSELLKSTLNLETFWIPSSLHSTCGKIVKLFPEDSKPELTSLENIVVFDHANPKQRRECCPTFLEELFVAAKNISYIDVWDSLPDDDGEEDGISSSLEVLRLIEKLGREPYIQDLRISHKQRDDHSTHVDILTKMAGKQNGLKIKKLHYDTYFSDEHSRPILKIISLFKNTLEFFKTDGKHFISFVEYPVMTRLTCLTLFYLRNFNSRFANLKNIFPVLEELHLDVPRLNPGYDEFFPQSEPCLKLKSLHLHSFLFKINGFNQMLTVFPNLIDFRVNIQEDSEEILTQIWSRMTQLEALKIYGTIHKKYSTMDCLFTGIPLRVLLLQIRDLSEICENLETKTEVERREIILNIRSQHSHLPSIGNLTKLRSLTLDLTVDGEERCTWKYLTDLTGYLGFYSMKSLKELTVEKCELTKTCCQILTKDMGLQTWTFKSSGGEDITCPRI